MTKLFSILALSFLFTLVACGPEKLILPHNPLEAQKSFDQSTILQPQYEGDEIITRADVQKRCRYRGIVEYIEENEACRFLIYLEDGTVLNPVNYNRLPIKIQNGMRVILDYQEARVYEPDCTMGEFARITCINELKPIKGE